jgi:DNA-directed RNA polymerase alpha subunit
MKFYTIIYINLLNKKENIMENQHQLNSILINSNKISQPAHRVLQRAGIETLEQLTLYKEEELIAFHGFGPKAMAIIKRLLIEYNLSFKI